MTIIFKICLHKIHGCDLTPFSLTPSKPELKNDANLSYFGPSKHYHNGDSSSAFHYCDSQQVFQLCLAQQWASIQLDSARKYRCRQLIWHFFRSFFSWQKAAFWISFNRKIITCWCQINCATKHLTSFWYKIGWSLTYILSTGHKFWRWTNLFVNAVRCIIWIRMCWAGFCGIDSRLSKNGWFKTASCDAST